MLPPVRRDCGAMQRIRHDDDSTFPSTATPPAGMQLRAQRTAGSFSIVSVITSASFSADIGPPNPQMLRSISAIR